MKNVRAMFGATILGLVLTNAALAGDVTTPGYVPPPPPSAAASNGNETALPGEIGSSGLMTELLIAALSAFYQ
ncbi:MAG TPA: hypothetical protein VJS64_18510 [Pyrinomonadaceae bacterium]|nr:hypothetical protein [Pyrinomonadaceae bacterium]